MNNRLRIDNLIPPENLDMVAEGYVDDECIIVVSQEHGFDSLEIEFVQRADGREWKIGFELFEELLRNCKDSLWRLRQFPGIK